METPATQTAPRLVRLIQCGRRSCAYVLTEDERDWKPDPEWKNSKRAVCPKCGDDCFYTLNEKGQQLTTKERDKYRDGIDPTTIEPSPRMGPKLRGQVLAAKRRALGEGDQAKPLEADPSPGPWDVSCQGHVVDADGNLIALTLGEMENKTAAESEAIRQANARVLAASEELREALKNLLPIAAKLMDDAFDRGESKYPSGNISEVIRAQAALGKSGHNL